MLLHNLEKLLAPSLEEYHVLHQDLMGFDVRDVERRAAAEKLPAWHVCSAAWSIVLARHMSQSSLAFLASDTSRQSTPDSWNLSSFTDVHASVDEDRTFSELLHKGLKISALDGQPLTITTSSTVVIHPFKSGAETTELLPPRIKSDINIQLLSNRSRSVQAICRYRKWLPGHYVEKVVHHFLHLLRHIVNHRAWGLLHVRDISLLSLEEELRLRQECRPSRSLADMEIGSTHQLVRRQARRTPNHPALQGPGGDVLTYLELDLISDLMAKDLQHRLYYANPQRLDTGLAVDDGVVVGIMLKRSPAVVIAILSCWKAGYAMVLVDPSQPASRNGYIIEDCGCALLLVDESWKGDIGKEIALEYNFSTLKDRAKAADRISEPYRAGEVDLLKDFFRPAWIRVTSGSTGRPKCALHSHAAFGSSIASYAGRIRSSKTLLFFNPISSASGNAIWTFLTNGGCVCIPFQEEITSDLAGCINKYAIDDICITPSALSLISPDQVATLKTASLAGEAVPQSVGETWSPYVSLLIGYGATEMNSHAKPFHDEPTGVLPPAHALPDSDYSLYILRPGTTDLCPLYVPGEICLSSTYMSSGYINRPEATSQVFTPHPFPGDAGHAYIYRTGDLGMFIGARRFVILGRVDFQFKVDGNRIQPEEVEFTINQVPQVVKSKVLLIEPSVGRPVLTCCVILKETLTNGLGAGSRWQSFVSAAEKACADHLPAHMMPHRWLQFEKFPETPTAKTDTKALAEEAKNIIDQESLAVSGGVRKADGGQISPIGELFLDLALEALAGHDVHTLPLEACEAMKSRSFIANGGTSLLSLQLRSRLRSRGVEISMSTLYSPQSLREVAASLSAPGEEVNEVAAEAAEPIPTVTEALIPRMPTNGRLDAAAFESIFPTTMLQREMFATSMLDPRLWMFYQFFDLSQSSCTVSQLREAIGRLASTQRNLRTVFSLLDVQENPTTIESPDRAFDLIRQGKFAQAVLKPSVFRVEFSQDDETEEPEGFRRKDVNRKWLFEQPLWRVTFLSKPRLLALTLHHAILDAWVARHLSQDLHAIVAAILQRDSSQGGWEKALTDAREKATKPSIEQWVLRHYGMSGLDGSPKPLVQRHLRVWEDFMANAAATPIPDELKLPSEALPAPPLMKAIDSLPYGEWCRQHDVTAAALFHAVGALTIARLLNWWRPDGPQEPAEEVTYYRLSSNRATVQDASEMEGALISISPMRVPVSAGFDAVAISQSALKNWLATQESDPYYLDDQLVATGPEPTARRRRWGNVLLNHIVNQETEKDTAPSFRGVVEDKCGFAMVWPFAAVELTVVETDSKKADALQLCVMSTLERQSTEDIMGIFANILRTVVTNKSGMSAKEILQKV